MTGDDETRSVEQELAAGQRETTPFLALSSVALVVALLVAVALTLAVIAYVLA